MEVFGPSAADQSNPQANPARLLNMFREPVPVATQWGKPRHLLRQVQGLKQWADSGEIFARDLINMDGVLHGAFGNHLYRFGADGTPAQLAPLRAGPTYLARNAERITIASDGHYFVWSGTFLSEPAPGAFDRFGSVSYLAGRTILTELDGNRFQWSDIDDPSTLNGLNFASAEQRDDKLLRGLAVSGVLMLFGERSTEIWSATGLGGASAFGLLPGAVVDTGIKAPALAVAIGGGVFCIGSDGIAYIAAGTQWQAVSTPAVNTAIAGSDPKRCLYWEYRGHKFAAVTFGSCPAWVYDLTTQEWHERAQGQGPWQAAVAVPYGSGFAFGATDGKVYTPVLDGTDAGGTLYRQATSGLLDNGGGYFTIDECEFGASYGFQQMNQSAALQLEVSRDGVTWGRSESVDLGFDGDFMKRAVFRRLGTSRKFAMRLTLSDPCDFSVYSDANVRLR